MPVIEGARNLKTYVGEYSFAVDGGAQGVTVLRSETGGLPAGSVVIGGFVDVTTACTSATGTMALHCESAADLVAAAGQASWTTGIKATVPTFTAATMKKTTVTRSPTLTIATAAFTAGVFRLVLYYT